MRCERGESREEREKREKQERVVSFVLFALLSPLSCSILFPVLPSTTVAILDTGRIPQGRRSRDDRVRLMTRLIRYLPPEARRVLILVNATAGARAGESRVDQLRQQLAASGLQVETFTDPAALGRAVGNRCDRSIRAVVAAGGDGTVAAVVNATPPGTPVTVLPLGTENLLAKYLAYPFSLDALRHTILHGATVALDAGRAGDRLFLLMVGCGFDAHVVRGLHRHRRGHIRHTTYIKPILESICRYAYPEIRIECAPRGAAGQPSGSPASGAARWVFVVNLPMYAGGLRIVPDAVGTDGLVDVCLFERGSLAHGLRYLSGILRGRHPEWEDCRCVRAERVRIESDGEVPYQLDGDPGGVLPVEIAAMPGRMCALVTETWAVRHGFQHAAEEAAGKCL